MGKAGVSEIHPASIYEQRRRLETIQNSVSESELTSGDKPIVNIWTMPVSIVGPGFNV